MLPRTVRHLVPHQRLVMGQGNGIISQCLERLVVSNGRPISSSASRINSVSVEKERIQVDDIKIGSHYEVESSESSSSVKETRTVDVYNLEPIEPFKLRTKYPIKGVEDWVSQNQQTRTNRAVKRYKEMEQKLKINDPTAYELVNNVQEPLIALASRNQPTFTVTDSSACREFLSHLGDVSDPQTVFVVTNPGAGVLSTQLLNLGAKKLMLFEQNRDLRVHLKRLHYKGQAECKTVGNRWNPWPVFVSDQPSIFTQSDCTETHYHLNTIFKTSTNTIQSVKIIHALTEHRQLTHLLTNYSCSNVPFDKKTVEFYFILDQSFGNRIHLVEEGEKCKSSLLYQLNKFMHSEILCTLPTDAFFPLFAPTRFGRKGNSKKNPNALVMRTSFRPLVSNGRALQEDERIFFSTFIRHCMAQPKSSRVVSSLEKWSPGIGLLLLDQGLSLFTTFNQLTHQEFLSVFFTFLRRIPIHSPLWATIRD